MSEIIFVQQKFEHLSEEQKYWYRTTYHSCKECDKYCGMDRGIFVKEAKTDKHPSCNCYRFCSTICFTSWMGNSNFKIKMVNFILGE